MSGRIAKLTLPVMGLALLLAGCDEQSEQAKTPPPPPPAVTVVKAEMQDLRPSVSFTGRIEAIDKVELRARIDGFLEERRFEEGESVKKGDLLFVIEKAPYKAAIEEVEGALAAAQATLNRADIEYQRQSTLVAKDVAARTKLDDVIAKREEARGSIAQLNATLDKAKLNLSYTDIVAPIDGRIGRAQFSVGNFVGPSSGPLATIVSQDPIYAAFAVTQREMLDIRKAQGGGAPDRSKVTVYLQLADGSRYDQPGQVDFVDVTVSQGTDTVQVRARFPNPQGILVDGQLVTVVAEASEAQSSLVIPQQALQVDQQGSFVLVVGPDKKIAVKRVELGPVKGIYVSVTKGLSPDDQVVTEGMQRVRAGQEVQAFEAKPGA